MTKVPIGDTEAFGEAALELLTNGKSWDEATKNAARTAKRFDWDTAAEKEWAILCRLGDRLMTRRSDPKAQITKGSQQ